MNQEPYVPGWPIKSLHQIEVTSICNLRCVYCTSPKLGREKLDMELSTFKRALEWVRYYVDRGTQGELNLAGIGESTMHPSFVEYVRLAREALGWGRRICFATNGLLMTDELARAIKPYKPEICVSMHRPEKAKPAIDILMEHGLLEAAAVDGATHSIDWAGQVDWKVTTDAFGNPCAWRQRGWSFVLADGRISTCCFDSDGSGVVGHVNDEPGSVQGRPYRLCKTCHLDVGIDGWRDRVEGRRAT